VADFLAGVLDLYTIASLLPAGAWGETTIDHSSAYRYVRYLSPDNGFCNVAEVEFYGVAMDISGVSEATPIQCPNMFNCKQTWRR
jgi:hypothetical protein